MFRLAELPAATKSIRKELFSFGDTQYTRKDPVEMMLQEMLQQASGFSIAEVLLRMIAPLDDELPILVPQLHRLSDVGFLLIVRIRVGKDLVEVGWVVLNADVVLG